MGTPLHFKGSWSEREEQLVCQVRREAEAAGKIMDASRSLVWKRNNSAPYKAPHPCLSSQLVIQSPPLKHTRMKSKPLEYSAESAACCRHCQKEQSSKTRVLLWNCTF
ncbi:uncharacterized protein GJ701_016290 isoform 2-T2 [Geothlypis trichas]